MHEIFAELSEIFSRTQSSIQSFVQMLEPVEANAETEKERLYFHHILEEEEQRLERLEDLLPRLKAWNELSRPPAPTSPPSPWTVGDLRSERK